MTRSLLLLTLAFCGCLDEPVAVPPLSGGAGVARLSQLGLFAEPISEQRPVAGVIPYQVLAPLWSDGAEKRRFVYAPTPMTTSDDWWAIHDGTYLVKTFSFSRDLSDPGAGEQLVETRVIAYRGDDRLEATYVWNAEQTDAFSSGGNLDVDIIQRDEAGTEHHITHHVPGTSQCAWCHRDGALGVRTPELADQLASLFALHVVDRVPATVQPFVDPYGDSPIEERVASYLDVNCAHCHSPGGQAANTHADWRRDHLLDNVCRDARKSVADRHLIIAGGDPAASIAIARMRSSDPYLHMPRGPSHVIDARALEMLEAWIRSLPRCP